MAKSILRSMALLLLITRMAVLWAGGPPGPLTLEDCLRLALAGPSPASIAERQVAISRAEQTVARSAFLPQFQMQNAYAYNSPLLYDRQVMSHIALNGIREYSFLFDTAWEVDLSGRLRAAAALARSHRALAQADVKVARRDVRRAVAGAYYDLLLTRRIADLEDAALRQATAFEQQTQARQSKGEASMTDVQKATAQRARFEQRSSRARMNAHLANQVLASFWTADVDRELQLTDALADRPAPPAEIEAQPEAAVVSLVSQRPEFERLEALQAGYRAERSAALSALRPQSSVIFQYGIDSNQIRIADRGYAAFVHLTIPLFDWFGARGAARQALYRERQVEVQRALTERAFSREYLAALSQVRSWYERIPMAETEFKASEENLRLTQLLYESGEGLALEVVSARTQATDAGAAYFAAIAGYLLSLSDFEVASGK